MNNPITNSKIATTTVHSINKNGHINMANNIISNHLKNSFILQDHKFFQKYPVCKGKILLGLL